MGLELDVEVLNMILQARQISNCITKVVHLDLLIQFTMAFESSAGTNTV